MNTYNITTEKYYNKFSSAQFLGGSEIIYDYVRLCMINVYDYVCLSMTMYDYVRRSMTMYDYVALLHLPRIVALDSV